MLKLRVVIVFILLNLSLYGSSAKYTKQATIPPISVINQADNYSGFYIGLGVGKFRLKDSFTKERLTSTTATVIIGYDFNQYLALEGRYTRSLHNLHYSNRKATSLNSKLSSTFSNIAIYGKIGYSIDKFKPYLLIGYGENKITNLAYSTRKELSFQYGVGFSYRFNKHWELFADYIRSYNSKGFDGRAKIDNIKINTITVGINRHF